MLNMLSFALQKTSAQLNFQTDVAGNLKKVSELIHHLSQFTVLAVCLRSTLL